jgi:hypothetical protein
MILYYTHSQKTKVLALALGEVLGQPVYQLQSDLNNRSTFGFMFKALRLAFSKKSYPVSNMPQELPREIYLCSPVWGGGFAAPVKYFLENANLADCVVNIGLTASVPVDKYKKKALDYLSKIPCKPGAAYIFATSDDVEPDKAAIADQLREMLAL